MTILSHLRSDEFIHQVESESRKDAAKGVEIAKVLEGFVKRKVGLFFVNGNIVQSVFFCC